MRYFIDTEFIEGFHKPLFGKRRHFIDLISIGIVAEDGREYYAISNEFNTKDADDWVKNNVIGKLPERAVDFYDSPRMRMESLLWKSNKVIANEVKEFIYSTSQINDPKSISNWEQVKNKLPIEFYGYYADYDWVLFCSLFGRMIDLPKGFPMYCRDLKQMFDERALKMTSGEATQIEYPSVTHDVFEFLEKTTNGSYKIDVLKKHEEYPKQLNEHNALDDARWSRDLYNFIVNLK